MSESDNSRRPTEIREQGVRIMKYLDDSEFDRLTAVFYNISCHTNTPVELSFREPIPDGLTFKNIQTHKDFEKASWTKDGEELVFTHTLEPDEKVTTLLGFTVPKDDIPIDFTDRKPVLNVDRLDAVDAKETVGEKLLTELQDGDLPEDVENDLVERLVAEVNDEAVTQRQLETVSRELRNIQDRMDDFQAELDSTRDRIADLKSKQVSIDEKTTIIERRLDDLQSDHEAELTSLNRAVGDVKQEMEEVREKTGELPDDVGGWLTDVESELDAVQSELDAAAGDEDALVDRLEHLRDDLVEVTSELEGFEEDVSTGFDNLRERVDETETHLSAVQTKAKSELEAAEEERDDLRDKIHAVRNGVERVGDSHSSLGNDVEDLDEIVSDLVVALHALETAVGADEGEFISEDLVDEATSGRFLK